MRALSPILQSIVFMRREEGGVAAVNRRFQQVGRQVAQRAAFLIAALLQDREGMVGHGDRDPPRAAEQW